MAPLLSAPEFSGGLRRDRRAGLNARSGAEVGAGLAWGCKRLIGAAGGLVGNADGMAGESLLAGCLSAVVRRDGGRTAAAKEEVACSTLALQCTNRVSGLVRVCCKA